MVAMMLLVLLFPVIGHGSRKHWINPMLQKPGIISMANGVHGTFL
jgi:hypothetical protein